jgi:hypothetical protein
MERMTRGRRTRAWLAAGVVALTAVLLAPAAEAARTKDVNQCAADNRWCHGVLNKNGRVFLDFAGFGLKGRYRVCVRPPASARERCRVFKLKPNGTGANASSVRFTRNFPHRRHGRYTVRWIYGGRQVGRALTFTA